jgi:flagellar biosynthesis/type III secretory pathway protein FliH
MGQPFVPLLLHVAAPLTTTPAPAPEPVAPPPDLDALCAQAREEGEQAARQKLEPRIRELEARLAAMGPILEDLPRIRKAALDQAAQDIVQMVLGIAHKVIGDSLTHHPDALPRLVQASLARLPDEDEISIRVPVTSVDRVMAVLPERHAVKVTPDPSLAKGCVVETRHASIDASLETVIEGLTQAATHWLAGRT